MGHPDPRPWPYAVGTRGINRVRVYDRSDSKIVQIEWVDLEITRKGLKRKRRQESLRTYFGEPIESTETGRTLARDIAEDISRAQGEKHEEKLYVATQAFRRVIRKRKKATGTVARKRKKTG